MTKKVCALLLVFMLTITQLSFAEVSSAANEGIDIRLQIDNELVTINGQETVVEKPYLANGSTLVPLRIITSAFGAVLDWDGATQTVKLTYGEQTIKVTIDSDQADVNGEAYQLDTAPELKNGNTMVPVRFISENFGAVVSFDPETLKIGITGQKIEGAGSSDTDIDSDAGKTRIGNSYYSWSIKYPPGLVKQAQDFNERFVAFKDAKDDFALLIGVEVDQDENMTKDGLLKYLSGLVEQSILDKSYVEEGTQSYARVISKEDKTIYEYRAYRVNDRIYHMRLSTEEEKYKNTEKLKNYKELLDSFKTSFDANDKALKDLSTVKDEKRKYTDDDLGITLHIPADWGKISTPEWLIFYNPDDSTSLNIRMTSAKEGDSADAWVKREAQYLAQEYVPDAIKFEPVKDIQIADMKAKLLKYSMKPADKWNTVYGGYVMKGKYKFEINVSFTKGKDDPSLVDTLLKAIAFKDNPSTALGNIEDQRDHIDRTKMSVNTNKKKKFSISIPDYWIKVDDADLDLNYSANAGSVSVSTIDDSTYEQVTKRVETVLNQYKDQLEDFTLIESGAATLNGLTGKKYVYSGKANNVPYQTTTFVVAKNDFVYVIDVITRKAMSTPENQKMFADIIQSFKALD
ncbi:copper amine oxidase N-terminal domain-containing protein [Paenibacillus contaminans]|uniref:Copper amine oxidase-like N-terminal domain-containing protein n=1 Tax=Paenibacillus contaminans TaxID=450362 RepID=A0A329MV55_9BACL|nr:copper amine oxidase N-terminal domain-containing protein [Paenibacillus contaminans]RAV23178.1 hypothetical protein DQG23_03005 [Paenibacillus contaminans]